MKRAIIRLAVVALAAATLPMLPTTPAASAESTGTGISYTLEGCRASTDAYLPGTFICPEDRYTTGNLLKGWNEFDLVPGRVTLGAGNNAPSSQTFSFVYAVDRCSTEGADATASSCTGSPGFDRLSVLVLNTSLSSTSGCDTTPTVSGPRHLTPGMGGAGTTLYREVTIDGQSKGTTCVYDFHARLAFNSHLYPGSSLHFNLANTDLGTAGIGSKEVSIPVREILAPGFSKVQSASRGSDVVWAVQKSSTPANVTFSETCPPSANPQYQAVDVTVSWTKTTTASGAVTVQAVISLVNNAHRSIDVLVSDQLYEGSTASGTTVQAPQVTTRTLAANATDTITHTWTVTGSSATSFSDRASATFTDTVYGDTLGTATATASSTVQTLAPTSGATAVITDVENLTDAGGTQLTTASPYRFAVLSVSGTAGSFSNYPTLGTQTVGPVNWSSGTVSSSGSTTFHKRVYVNAPTQDTARLADVATLSPDSQSSTSASASSAISSNATVSLTIRKTIPVVLGSGDANQTFTFPVTGPGGYSVSHTITFTSGEGGPTSPKTVTVSGLAPGSYTVNENELQPYAPQSPQVVNLSLPTCSGTASFANTFGPASAQARKVTNPAGSEAGWELILTGPGTPSGGEKITTTGTDYITFQTVLQEGSYTITETPQTGWDQTGSSSGCTFAVNYPADADRIYQCTLTNTQRGRVTVLKTENGGVNTHVYTFRLTGGPDSVSITRATTVGSVGNLDFGLVKPGSYTLCELAVPAGTRSTLQDQGGTVNATTGDICLTFTLAAGATRAFTIDNSFPGGGQRTIGYWKNWNTYRLGSAGWAKAERTGNHLMDEFLPQSLGNYVVDTAQKGYTVLSNASSKYAENMLAAQLLAAKLNVSAGASTCTTVTNAISTGNSLLIQIGYTGPPSYKVHSTHTLRTQFLNTARTLDRYNNGLVC